MTKDESGVPLGIMDTHGRGLFISREYVDRFIINLHPGKATEIIVLNYKDPNIRTQHKPLLINEL